MRRFGVSVSKRGDGLSRPGSAVSLGCLLLFGGCAQGSAARGDEETMEPVPTSSAPPASSPSAVPPGITNLPQSTFDTLPDGCSPDGETVPGCEDESRWLVDCDGDGIPGYEVAGCAATRATKLDPNAYDCNDTNPDWFVVVTLDADGDGFGASGAGTCTHPDLIPDGYGSASPVPDCDDTDSSAYPGADDPWGDGIDSDCDGDDAPSCSVLEAGDGVAVVTDAPTFRRLGLQTRAVSKLELGVSDAGLAGESPVDAGRVDAGMAPLDGGVSSAPTDGGGSDAGATSADGGSELRDAGPSVPDTEPEELCSDLFIATVTSCWDCWTETGSGYVFVGNQGPADFDDDLVLHYEQGVGTEVVRGEHPIGALAAGEASPVFGFDSEGGSVELWLGLTGADEPLAHCSPSDDRASLRFRICI